MRSATTPLPRKTITYLGNIILQNDHLLNSLKIVLRAFSKWRNIHSRKIYLISVRRESLWNLVYPLPASPDYLFYKGSGLSRYSQEDRASFVPSSQVHLDRGRSLALLIPLEFHSGMTERVVLHSFSQPCLPALGQNVYISMAC